MFPLASVSSVLDPLQLASLSSLMVPLAMMIPFPNVLVAVVVAAVVAAAVVVVAAVAVAVVGAGLSTVVALAPTHFNKTFR